MPTFEEMGAKLRGGDFSKDESQEGAKTGSGSGVRYRMAFDKVDFLYQPMTEDLFHRMIEETKASFVKSTGQPLEVFGIPRVSVEDDHPNNQVVVRLDWD